MSVQFEYLISTELSDIGRRRSRNEDAVIRVPEYGVFCLADGMGGGDAGDEASRRTVQGVADAVRERLAGETAATAETKCRVVRRAVNQASQWINQRARERGRGMSGSTVVTLVFDPVTPGAATVLHAGDSRLYRFRKNALTQITNDHSFAAEAGYKSGDQIPQQFRGVVTRAVGIKESVELEQTALDVAKDDLLLICSDGLSGMVPDRKMRKLCRRHADKSLDDLAQELVKEANEAGGKDNISVVLVRAGELVPIPASEAFNLPDEESEEEVTTEETLPKPFVEEEDEGVASTEEELITGPDPRPDPERAALAETEPALVESRAALAETEPALVESRAAPPAAAPPVVPKRSRKPLVAAVLLALLAAGALTLWKVLPRPEPASGPQEWIASMQVGREEGEAYLAYAKRLKDYVVQLDQFAEQYPESTAVGEAAEAVRARARGVPQALREEFDRQVARGSRRAAARLIEEWGQIKQYCGLLGLDDSRHGAMASGMQERMAGLDRLDAVREVSGNVQFETAYLKQLAGHLEELDTRDDGSDEGVRQAVLGIRQAAFEWCKQFDRSFERIAKERNVAALELVLLKWDSLGQIAPLLELVKERYGEQRGEIDKQLRVWGASLTDDVNAELNRDAVDAAGTALRKLRALAHALRKSSFAPSVASTYTAAAEAVDRAGRARAAAGNEASRVRKMIGRIDGLDITKLSETLAAFGSLKGLQGVDPAVVDELRADAQARLVSVCRDAAAGATEAFKAIDVERGDKLVGDLVRFVERVPKELGRDKLSPFLDQAGRARAEAERRVGDLAKKLNDAAATLADAGAADRWAATVGTLSALAARRNLNATIKSAWGQASSALEKRLSDLVTEVPGEGQSRENVTRASALLKLKEIESVLAGPVLDRLRKRVADEWAALDAGAGFAEWTRQVRIADAAGVSGVLRALGAADAKWLPALRGRLAPRVEVLVAACAARTKELVAKGTDLAVLWKLVNQEEFLRFVPAETCRELVAAISKRDQRTSFQTALRTGAWGTFWRNVGSAPDDTRPLAEMGIETASREWHALWTAALADIMARQRKDRLEEYRDASRRIYDAAGLASYMRGAPDWTSTREEWADYYCRYAYETGQHMVAGLGKKDERIMTVVDSLARAPANAPDDMWAIVGLNRAKDASKVPARLGAIREDLDALKAWGEELRENPLTPARARECPARDIPLLKRVSVE